jgi:signal transduction histidine kinase
LRNPIAAVDAGITRLLKEGLTERSPLILKLMKSSLSRMSGLVDNVMDLARSRLGGGIGVTLAEANLAQILANVVDEIRVAHPDREIDLRLELPGKVTVDQLRVAQMISNLLSNAVTHGDANSAIAVTGYVKETTLEIGVRNGGPPIPCESIPKLFLPFKRGDGASGGQGLGLGLYIASQIAKAHCGRIDVRSDESETSFTFRMSVN